jgi:Phosphoglycerate dehydrogenase and related dehydrogenases
MNIAVAMPVGITRDSFIPPEVRKQIEAMGTVSWNTSDRDYEPAMLRDVIRCADVCITGWGCSRFDEYVLEESKRLKLIAHTGGSVASLVSKQLYDKGIKILSGNALFAESVAEGVIGYILAALRDIPSYSNDVQAGIWRGQHAYNEGLLDQSVGLVGFGAVARYLVPMLKVFRAGIRVYDPFVSDEICGEFDVERVSSLEELLATSKIISLHAPGVPETRHMIGSRLLSMIPDGALLVNTARGRLIDEEALADELQKGRFKAVLDVYEVEPLPKESRLRGLKNVLLLPHMAGPTVDRRKLVTAALLEDIRRYFDGQPLKHEIKMEYAVTMTR